MSKSIRTIYRNSQIELPPEVQLPDNTYVTVILPNDLPEDGKSEKHDLVGPLSDELLLHGNERVVYGIPLATNSHQDAVRLLVQTLTIFAYQEFGDVAKGSPTYPHSPNKARRQSPSAW